MMTKKIGTRNDATGSTSSFERVFAAIDEVAVVQVLQDQAGGERAHDRRQPDDARGPRQHEAEGQAHRRAARRRP